VAEIVTLHAKDEVELFCRRNPFLHLYSIGDLDDFFWPYTTWYALRTDGCVRQLVLVYTGQVLPTVLALTEEPLDHMRELLRDLLRVLPRRFYAHLTEGTATALEQDHRLTSHGAHYKMGLTDPGALDILDGSAAVPLTSADTVELQALYAASYPGNWFAPRMLQTGFYFGVRRGTQLVSVAGVHVYSQKYQVAALGNITTLPDYRRQGLATVVTARLCQELRRAGIQSIGLNVKADNRGAIACYDKIGFTHVADYGEFSAELK
jgi:ribosomal protein S18 acetylase RimI-like enzyme